VTNQPRARDLGIRIGSGEPGSRNAITDVAGVRVGHQSIVRGEDGARDAIRTGVTTVFPREAAPWAEPVYAATHILNGYGELIGINSMAEWGILESPIVLTSSQQIGKAFDASVAWMATKDIAAAEAVMPCVTECDDSFLNAVLERPLTDQDVFAALDAATGGPVEEGCVGSGIGMQCFDFKGGLGTASRVLPADAGGYTVGVLVMTNHGDRPGLLVDGVPVGEHITDLMPIEHSEGSCIVIVATDAPLMPHQLRRVAQRAGMGLARGGSYASNGSGEQFIAFSTANAVPLDGKPYTPHVLADGSESWQVMSSVFKGTIEATEEAVVNAMLASHTTVGRDGNTLFALPVDRLLSILRNAGRLSA
jgi:D-aminopeptidase